MKIGIIHLNLGTESGDPRMALSIGKTLHDEGHTVEIYTAHYDINCFPALANGLRINVISPRIPFASLMGATSVIGKIIERIRRWRVHADVVQRIEAALDSDFDVLCFQNDDSYKIGVPYKKRNPHVKTVWIMHNPPFYHSPKLGILTNLLSKLRAAWEYQAARTYAHGIDTILTYDKEKEAAGRLLGVREVVRRGIPVDFDHFYVPLKPKTLASITLLSVGALSPSRRFEDTIMAVKQLRAMGHDARAIIVCKDFWTDATYRAAFEKTIVDSGVSSYLDVRFRGATEEELRVAFVSCDFFVFPSNIKIWGMTVFEAMAAGLPVVVSTASSVVEILQDNETALFVPPERPDRIADGVHDIVMNPAKFEMLRVNGQAMAKKDLSWREYTNLIIKKND